MTWYHKYDTIDTSMRKKGNKIVSLSVPPEKVRELKIKAAQAGKTLSEFMVESACEVSTFTTQTIPYKGGK